MKLFAFIMASIYLSLSLIPCADAGFSGSKAKQEISSTQEKGDHKDDCSPFCQCACCAGFSINQNIANIQEIVPGYIKNYSSFNNSTIVSISFPVWQPPQLAA